MLPGEDVFKPERLAAEIFSLLAQRQRAVQQDALPGMGDAAMDVRARRRALQQQPYGQGSGVVVLLQPGLEPQVGQVQFRLRVEEHRAEDSAEPEEVLILDPGRAAALVDLHAQPVSRVPDVGGEVKVRGSEGVLTVSDKMTVEPDIKCLLHALEADTDPSAPQSRRQVKFTDIAAYRVVVPIDLRRTEVRVTVPGIEGVDILNPPISLQLHMAGDLNQTKAGAVKILLPECRRAQGGGLAPGKAPKPVQRLAQGGDAAVRFGGGGIAYMVGVGVQAVYLEYGRVSQPVDISLHNQISLSSRFLYYTTIKRQRKEEL